MKTRMKAACGLAALCVVLLINCQTVNRQAGATAKIERGRYLVNAIGCNDCHTPLKMTPTGPQPDMARMLSGHPAEMKMPRPPKMSNDPWL